MCIRDRLLLGVGHIQHKKGQHEKPFVPGLQFVQQLFGVLAVSGKLQLPITVTVSFRHFIIALAMSILTNNGRRKTPLNQNVYC